MSHCRTTAMIATGNQSIFSKNTKQKDQIQNLTTFLQVLIRVQKVQFINCWLPPQGVISVFISVSRVSRLVTPSGSSVPSLQTQITSCQHCQQQSSSQLVTWCCTLTFIDKTTCSNLNPFCFGLPPVNACK